MKISRANALRLWERRYGDAKFAEDFHGCLMCRDAYGDDESFVVDHGTRIYCGWNIHHILPVALGGTNAVSNLVCTNIATNAAAEDKITFWIDNSLYQVKRICGTHYYEIVELN